MSDGVPIVICCSDEDLEAIQTAAQPLVDDGNAVHFVQGVVDNPRLLAAKIEELQREGLYVLCRSKGLGRATIEELREVLLAQQVPFSRTLTVAATRPGMVTDRIRSSLGRVMKATATRRPPTASPRPAPPRPAAKPTLPKPATQASPPVRPKTSPPPLADDPPTERMSKLRAGAGSTPTSPAAAADFVPYADSEDPPTNNQLRGDPATDDSPNDALDETPDQAPDDPPNDDGGFDALPSSTGLPPPPPHAGSNRGGASRSEDSVIAPLPRSSSVELLSGLAPTDEESGAHIAASISDIDLSDLDYGDTSIGRAPVAGPNDGTVAVRHASIGLRTGETAIAHIDDLRPEGTVRALPPTLDRMNARSVADPVASMSIAVAPGTPPPVAAHPSVANPLASPTLNPPAAPPPTHAAASAGPGPGIGRGVWIAGGVAAAALLALVVVCSVGGSSDDADDDAKTVASKDTKDKADKTDKAAPAEDSTPSNDDPAPSAEPADDGAGDGSAAQDAPPSPVLAAIQRRSVRALDILLVTTDAGGIMGWNDAETYCRTLTVDALVDWRLPALGELRSLGAAGMLKNPVTYWSATSGDTFGDEYLAWLPRRRRVVDSAKTAQTLCVRGDRARS